MDGKLLQGATDTLDVADLTTTERGKISFRRGTRPIWRDYLEVAVVALILAFILRAYVVQAFRIPTGSMENTLLPGDFVLTNKFIFHFKDPAPGDVVVFRYPLNPERVFIKRCVAVGGQTVEIRNKILRVDGKVVPNPSDAKHKDPKILPRDFSARDNFGPKQVPLDQFFVLGDNRDESQDSREWGFLERKYLIGKPIVVYWSWKPDPQEPRLEPPYVIEFISLTFYNLMHLFERLRFDRLGMVVD
ncbi:MAG: signal peptidase I [candidate division Zixibacteria bacterium]|nr:signal peptidase I [candidate division Zixibacteria bacterium]